MISILVAHESAKEAPPPEKMSTTIRKFKKFRRLSGKGGGQKPRLFSTVIECDEEVPINKFDFKNLGSCISQMSASFNPLMMTTVSDKQ